MRESRSIIAPSLWKAKAYEVQRLQQKEGFSSWRGKLAGRTSGRSRG